MLAKHLRAWPVSMGEGSAPDPILALEDQNFTREASLRMQTAIIAGWRVAAAIDSSSTSAPEETMNFGFVRVKTGSGRRQP